MTFLLCRANFPDRKIIFWIQLHWFWPEKCVKPFPNIYSPWGTAYQFLKSSWFGITTDTVAFPALSACPKPDLEGVWHSPPNPPLTVEKHNEGKVVFSSVSSSMSSSVFDAGLEGSEVICDEGTPGEKRRRTVCIVLLISLYYITSIHLHSHSIKSQQSSNMGTDVVVLLGRRLQRWYLAH